MSRQINQVAVLGSGIMGSRIACHFANAGIRVLLLDIVPRELNEAEKKRGLDRSHPAVRNRIVNEALQATLKANPSALYAPGRASYITTGNFEDNMPDIAGCDWVMEAVVENLEIKRSVFEQAERFRRPGTLITSNTSGIPIHLMAEGRSDDFKKHFCGTHFFNPPRYLRLLEVIPTAYTDPEVVSFLVHFGDLFLGKTTVLCKDTPAFIANRVGVFSMMSVLHIMQELGLNVDEIDTLTGPVIGHPKSATFRTADVVGIDTLVKVANGLLQNCPGDEGRAFFEVPDFVNKLVADQRLGEKSGAGFYKKEQTLAGKEIRTLDISTLQYVPRSKARFASLDQAKSEEDLRKRLPLLLKGTDKAADFYRRFHALLFSYVSHRVPEIADELYKIDDALKAGFGWEAGPFETWDILGVEAMAEQMEQMHVPAAPWVKEMLAAGKERFYQVEDGRRSFYDQEARDYRPIEGMSSYIILENFSQHIVWQNSACKLYDLGDSVLCLDWKTKMNTIGGEVLEGIRRSVALAEKDFAGLVIGHDATIFSAGANIALIFMLAAEQEWDELHLAVKNFQDTSMRIRYSSVPVVVATSGLALGGGCEFSLHADAVQAQAETYMGLVEAGVGLIPAGGGTKEFALRAGDDFKEGEVALTILQKRFITIGTAKVSASAEEAFAMGMLRPGRDTCSMNQNRLLADAKRKVLQMAAQGYVHGYPRNDVKVLGREGLGALLTGINGMWRAHYISEHDVKIARKLAYVMCGGDLSQPAQVSEQYLLDLEREAFVSLCGEPKTLERLQSVLKTGKPVRN